MFGSRTCVRPSDLLHARRSTVREHVFGNQTFDKPPTLARRKRDRRPLVAALVPKGTITVPIREVEFVAGPGRDPNAPTWRVLRDGPHAT